jgi:superfamily II DNA or RNA helicase
LRDNNWKEEFKQWDAFDIYNTIDRYCYASISKVKDEQYDLVILDEAHNITENNVSFFENNQIANTIALTATPPKDDIKIGLLKELKLNTVLHVTLDEGVELGIVAPYNITVIEMQLDDTDKYITAGNKVKPLYDY